MAVFKESLEKVQNSLEFKEFIDKNPSAKLVSGFFIIDFLSNDSKKSIDYKKGEDIFIFDLFEDSRVVMKKDELIKGTGHKPLEKINSEIKVEVEDLKGIAGIKILDEGIHSKMNKIIAVLQRLENKTVWNLTCMLDGLIIINMIVDSMSEEIIKFERKSMMDMIRKR
ncbi:hypothetical protein GOV12_00905 [Candidatus Pacearchaeota archaeon]|nr:hypothetical protein [Candidatus Pacearchaeota archaeon]